MREQELSSFEQGLTADHKKIIKLLGRVRASYPSEIARLVYLDDKNVSRLVDDIVREGVIVELRLDPNIIPFPLLGRLDEMWRKGIMGHVGFARMRWVALADARMQWADAETLGVEEARLQTLTRAVEILVRDGFPAQDAHRLVFGKKDE